MRKRGAIKNDNLPLKSLSVNLPAKKVLRTPRKDEFYIIVLSGGVLPYMGYIGICRCEGYGFQAVYSRIGYHFFRKLVSWLKILSRLGIVV